ncbi:dimer_Tnp_hAT domain-containing protein [Trichonephila clavipes]|nr:dimer_Tnp_hAT domain-containing protein [Trichonephila clavipes]
MVFFDFMRQVNWLDIENCVDFLSKEMPDIKKVDNGLFEEIRRRNVYFNYDKLKQMENQQAEINKRWVEKLSQYQKYHVPYEILVILVEFTLSCRGINAPVERVFSVIFSKSRLNVDILVAVLTLR